MPRIFGHITCVGFQDRVEEKLGGVMHDEWQLAAPARYIHTGVL